MSKLQAAEKTFEFFFNRLVKGYKSIMGRDPEGLDLIKIRQEAKTKQIDANKVVEVQFGKPFGEEVNALIKSGDVNIGTANKTPAYTPSKSQTDFEIQTRIESDNAKAIEAFKKRNPKDDMATGGRAGYYGGGQAMVGEDLSEIGHGADALMARNMQLSPNGQATTSTGLNYLLGQDNETVRVPYNKGKAVAKVADKGRRGFMKAAGATTAGIAALKTGLLGFGEKVAPVAKEAVEAATSAAQSVPPYFFKLVEKIKTLGDDASNLATQDRQKVTKFKDYEMTEDISTGNIEIIKKERGGFREDVYMSYKVDDVPIKGKKGSTKVEEYEEYTARPDQDGKMRDVEPGVPDSVVMEVEAGSGNVPESFYTGPNPIKKADGGRIGFGKGDIVTKGIPALIKAGEGKFTKAQYLIERIKNTIKGSPDDKYVQETFPNFIKELEANPDLAKNENVFKELGGDLPEGQQIVVYGDDTLDFFTTSSGPKNIKKLENFMAKHNLPKDQALKIMKMEPNDQVMELTKTKFLKQKRTDNASGGIATMLGE